MTSRRATVATVAAHAGVSTQTVSNAINAPHRLLPQTLDRVLAAIEELQYRPHHAARALKTSTANAIGCRLQAPGPRASGGVFERFLYALSEAAQGARYGLLCHAAASDEDEIAVFDALLRQGSVDGFVITATRHHDPRPTWLLQHDVPFVCFGRPWGDDEGRHSWVDVDGAAGTAAATTHLIEQGHRRIAYVGWRGRDGLGQDRRAGWAQVARASGLPRRGMTATCIDTVDGGESAGRALLGRADPPSAFVCVSDEIGLGVMRAVHDAGLRVGSDVGVVGFDDSVGSRLVRPELSTLRQPLQAAAGHVMRILLAQAVRRHTPPEHVLLQPELLVRPSSISS